MCSELPYARARLAVATNPIANCCDCDCDCTLFGLWRHMDGEHVFTGIVTNKHGSSGVFKKLDDPRDELDGPGHMMEESEILSQFSLYDNSSINRAQKTIDVCSFAGKELDFGDINFFDKYMEKLGSPGYEAIEFFPHDVTRVRADDRILLKANGSGVDPTGVSVPAVERFFAHVVSITPCGKITAVPCARLLWAAVTPKTPILVPLEAVMAVKRGGYWE